ncbi:MAG: hypothetical protein PUC32_03975 [Oscillospiraceae bacterium]|nr:hypothetical protein [Oscillospiraceae bacterium]
MKKLGIFLILGGMCASILAGCSATQTASESSEPVSSAVVSSEPSSAVESTTSTESEIASESAPEGSSAAPSAPVTGTAAITVALDEQDGNNVGKFFQISGVENGAVSEINSEIDDLMDEYREESTKGDGSWAEYRSFSETNSKYLSIVVHHNTYPTYGDQGDIESFVYDIGNEKIVTLDEVLQMTQKPENQIVSHFKEYYVALNENNQYRSVSEVDIEGFALHENGEADLYLHVETDDSPDAPAEYQAGSSKELYVFHTADASFDILYTSNIL